MVKNAAPRAATYAKSAGRFLFVALVTSAALYFVEQSIGLAAKALVSLDVLLGVGSAGLIEVMLRRYGGRKSP
ncbi:MAG TPA: hypothetical protein VMD91_01275 [Candidatus Sulfotelmatobacter sp.]|nr:hypothetical protein [Candidatus Sulfotelmatobacter sp.]